nr:MAG TPA: hypothetical protein [Caudoviricetes sp.]
MLHLLLHQHQSMRLLQDVHNPLKPEYRGLLLNLLVLIRGVNPYISYLEILLLS